MKVISQEYPLANVRGGGSRLKCIWGWGCSPRKLWKFTLQKSNIYRPVIPVFPVKWQFSPVFWELWKLACIAILCPSALLTFANAKVVLSPIVARNTCIVHVHRQCFFFSSTCQGWSNNRTNFFIKAIRVVTTEIPLCLIKTRKFSTMGVLAYCKSTIFGRYKIWWIYYILSDNRGFSLYNPI